VQYGCTALINAARNGYMEIVEMILKKEDVKVNIKNNVSVHIVLWLFMIIHHFISCAGWMYSAYSGSRKWSHGNCKHDAKERWSRY
jgi:hypothetical protein